MDKNDYTIEYPCQWEYTVIGFAEDAIRNAINETFSPQTPEITPSNKSKTGKYVSFSFSVKVESEEDRNAVFTTLQQLDAIRMVL